MTPPEQAREVDRNYDFFMRHLGQYLPEHRDQYALLKNEALIGFFEKPGDAYREGLRRYADQVFSIQEVTDEPIDLGFFSHVAH